MADDSASFQSRRELNLGKLLVQSNSRSRTEISNDRPCIMLAEMGEHQFTIRDYLRHSNLHVTNKYLQATSKSKSRAQDELVGAILPAGLLPKPNLVQERERTGGFPPGIGVIVP